MVNRSLFKCCKKNARKSSRTRFSERVLCVACLALIWPSLRGRALASEDFPIDANAPLPVHIRWAQWGVTAEECADYFIDGWKVGMSTPPSASSDSGILGMMDRLIGWTQAVGRILFRRAWDDDEVIEYDYLDDKIPDALREVFTTVPGVTFKRGEEGYWRGGIGELQTSRRLAYGFMCLTGFHLGNLALLLEKLHLPGISMILRVVDQRYGLTPRIPDKGMQFVVDSYAQGTVNPPLSDDASEVDDKTTSWLAENKKLLIGLGIGSLVVAGGFGLGTYGMFKWNKLRSSCPRPILPGATHESSPGQ